MAGDRGGPKLTVSTGGTQDAAPERPDAASVLPGDGLGDQRNGSSGSSRRRNRKTSELIARDLVSHIVRNGLPQGTMLPTEREMVEAFGVGRTTLREALRLLETRGVITIRSGPRGGPVVRRPQPSDLSEALTLILEFEEASLADVLEAREVIEPMVARLAAERMTADSAQGLQDIVDAMLENLHNHQRFLRENQRFHNAISQYSANTVLRVFSETLKWIADGSTLGISYTPARRRAVAEAHQRIVDAIVAGDGAQAEACMRSHLDKASRYWRKNHPALVSGVVHWG